MKPTNLCVHEHYLILENLEYACPCKELNTKHMKNKLIIIVCISLELLEWIFLWRWCWCVVVFFSSGDNYATPDRIALDPSNGYVYYTAVSMFNTIFIDSYIGVLKPDGTHTMVITYGLYPGDIVLDAASG